MTTGASVCFSGRSIIVNRLRGSGTEALNIGWGTGNGVTGASNANVNMFQPATEARTAGTSSGISTSFLADTYKVTGSITATAAKTITEVALFDTTTLSPTTTLFASATASATSITLAAAIGPTTGNFYIELGGLVTGGETVLVTGGQNTTLVTIVRGQLGSVSGIQTSGASVTVGGDGGANTSWAVGGQTASVPASLGGNMFAHADFAGLALNSGDSILFTVTDQFSGA